MGEWTITIHGHGIHHNGRDNDADRLVQKFVDELADKGQWVESASITVGARTHLGIPVNGLVATGGGAMTVTVSQE
jgi:hypothetical protein